MSGRDGLCPCGHVLDHSTDELCRHCSRSSDELARRMAARLERDREIAAMPPVEGRDFVRMPKPYRGAGGYLFALDQLRRGMRELESAVKNTDRPFAPMLAHVACARAYLVDAERALEDAITEVPPLPGHGVRRG